MGTSGKENDGDCTLALGGGRGGKRKGGLLSDCSWGRRRKRGRDFMARSRAEGKNAGGGALRGRGSELQPRTGAGFCEKRDKG